MFKNFFDSDKKSIYFLVVFGIICYLYNIGGWDLWAPDEPRFGQIPKEMIQSGNYMVPHLNGKPYSDKPPLNFWETALVSKVFFNGKVDEFTTRLPSAIAAFLGLFVIFYIAKTLYNDRKIALLSSLIMGTSIIYFDQGHTAQLDMTVSFWVYVSILAFLLRYKDKTKSAWITYLFWVAAALATLSKGPPGIIVAFGTVATFLISNKEFKQKIKIINPISGFLVFAAMMLVWLIPAVKGGDSSYSSDLLWTQTVVRYLHPVQHNQPIWYYLEYIITDYAPWSLFLPFAIWFGYKNKKNDPNYLNFKFNMCWLLFTLVFFTLSPGKRSQYIFPMYPAMAIITAVYWKHLIDKYTKTPIHVFISVIILLVLVLVGTAAATIVLNMNAETFAQYSDVDFKHLKEFPILSGIFLLLSISLLLGYCLINRKPIITFAAITIMMITLMISIVSFYYPAMNGFKSGREFCMKTESIIKDNRNIAIYDFFRADYMFYGNYLLTRIEEKDEVENFFSTDKRVFCIIRTDQFNRIQDFVKDKKLYILYSEPIGHRSVSLISNYSK